MGHSEKNAMSMTICVAATKDGVGKTKLTANLGAILADLDQSLPLVDSTLDGAISRLIAGSKRTAMPQIEGSTITPSPLTDQDGRQTQDDGAAMARQVTHPRRGLFHDQNGECPHDDRIWGTHARRHVPDSCRRH